MKITLVEERDGRQPLERSFVGPTIKVGRDSAVCQIVFDVRKWPTVSRQHAEFHLKDGHWRVVDLSSRYGTYVDKRRITEPTEVVAGTKVQFGTNGPVVQIARIARDASPDENRVDDV